MQNRLWLKQQQQPPNQNKKETLPKPIQCVAPIFAILQPRKNYHNIIFSDEAKIEIKKYDLECVIRTFVVFDPVNIECGHLFCRECLLKVKNKCCPSCRKSFSGQPLLLAGKCRRDICQLKINCMNIDKGCNWIDSLGEENRNLIQHHTLCD
jgi:hypothetical protein